MPLLTYCSYTPLPQLTNLLFYFDTDTIWVRPLEKNIRTFDAVGTYDWPYWNHPFPDIINFGVLLGKRNAPYWHKFQVGCGVSRQMEQNLEVGHR